MLNTDLQGLCPFCKSPILPEEKCRVCPGCEVPHHDDCWRQNRGCTTFACKGIAVKRNKKNDISYSFDDLATEYAKDKIVVDLDDYDQSEDAVWLCLSAETTVNNAEHNDSRNAGTPLLRALIMAGITGGLVSAAISSFFYYTGLLSLIFGAAIIGTSICLSEVALYKNTFKLLPRALIGLLAGAAGGYFGVILAQSMSATPLITHTIIWGVIGSFIGMGNGVGFSLDKARMGLAGGLIGGVVSGFPFFYLTNSETGFVLAYLLSGLLIGLGIGITYEIYKNAWLSVTRGKQAGLDYIIVKDVTSIGKCPFCDIYLPLESEVLFHHAELIKVQTGYKIIAIDLKQELFINNVRVQESILKRGDRVRVGSCEMIFNARHDI